MNVDTNLLNGWENVLHVGSWNSFFEEKVSSDKGSKKETKRKVCAEPLNNFKGEEKSRLKTGFDELDRVLGGGLIKGSLVLLGGEPGIGKSTLILQLCNKIKTEGKVLYVSGEESAEQIKLRADRLQINNDDILFLGETDIDIIEENILDINPKLVIIDSVQTMYSDDISSAAGSVSQVREITARIMKMCKQKQITTIIIGHVTKDGNIAGPRVLEHMVDTVLYIEGERYFSYRILRSVKNRFGSTNEIGMFEMEGLGMKEIIDPSSVLISERKEDYTGSVIVASMEGTRPIDYNRLTLLIAVLEKKSAFTLGNQDVYLNVVGGIKVSEPALDLGIVLSVASSYKNKVIPKNVVVMGEVGLTGEVRSINFIEKRLKEAEKLGFEKCIIPENNKKLLKDKYKLDIIGVKDVNEAIDYLGLK